MGRDWGRPAQGKASTGDSPISVVCMHAAPGGWPACHSRSNLAAPIHSAWHRIVPPCGLPCLRDPRMEQTVALAVALTLLVMFITFARDLPIPKKM